ncbi:MAG: amidohydrolase family protein [Thermoproteota archaeon]|jgi:imidazolonepropionase-like amidohydrolase
MSKQLSLQIKGAKVFTMDHDNRIFKGNIMIKNGKIEDVTTSEVKNDDVSNVIDAEGLVAVPGFIDAHTHIGIIPLEWDRDEQAVEKSDPITPQLKVTDALNMFDSAYKEAIEGGITSVAISTGSYMSFGKIVEAITIIPGQVIVTKTNGTILNEEFGIKIAVGEHPKRFLETIKLTPTTRMGMLAAIRTYMEKTERYLEKKEDNRQIDLKLEALAKLIKGESFALVHAHLSRDIVSIVRLLSEYNVKKIIVVHGTEAYEVGEFLRERNIPVILGPIVFSKRGTELRKLTSKLPLLLYKSKVKFCLTTDHPTIPVRYLPLLAAVAVSEGLPYEEALKAITINAAEILGISDTVGSIEVGKDADIVLMDGDPLDPDSKVVYTIIEGNIAYKR